MIKFSQPKLNYSKTIKILREPLKNNFPNEGHLSEKLSQKISKILKVKYATLTTSGSSALLLALKTLNIGHGDEVIVPNFTYQATANAVNLAGAKVVLIDVDPDNLLIDVKKLKKNISKKTKAIIAVHVSGRGSNILKLKNIARKNKVFLIEDAAEALFSKYKKKYLGTIGDIGCFSFAPNKILTTGQGGLIVTNNSTSFNKILKFKNHGKTNENENFEVDFDIKGFNLKFTDVQAALGLSQITEYKKRIQYLTEIHRYYEKNLKNLNDISLIKFNISSGELPLWTDIKCKDRNKLFKYLKSKKISGRLFWKPISKTKAFKSSEKELEVSSKMYKSLMWLPSSLSLKKKDLFKIVKNINLFYKRKK